MENRRATLVSYRSLWSNSTRMHLLSTFTLSTVQPPQHQNRADNINKASLKNHVRPGDGLDTRLESRLRPVRMFFGLKLSLSA